MTGDVVDLAVWRAERVDREVEASQARHPSTHRGPGLVRVRTADGLHLVNSDREGGDALDDTTM